MRLLNLRFRNLNSLTGEWQIDLTHPAYVADGLFAITGPTGSGKSTLLDAICLALYGRTPRLARINNTVNDIMSRHTGDCFAELAFETAAGQFRAHWSQRRARQRPDGRLQNPAHELADALTGEVLESSLRGVASRVPEVTGMDFEQFTRSVLLAQGGFAAFLQASADERAPLLEQITGTALYTTLSIRVHERRAAERQALDELEHKLQGNQPITPEQREELEQALRQEQARQQHLDADLNAVNQALRWLENNNALAEERRQLLARQETILTEQAAFSQDDKRLQRAEQALLLTDEHARIDALRRQQQQCSHDLAQQTGRLPELEQTQTKARAAVDAAERALREAQQQWHDAEPELGALRALLARIERLDESRTRHNAALHVLATEHQELQAVEAKAAQTLQQQQAELARHRAWQADNTGNAALGQALTGLESELRQLRGLEQKHAQSLADARAAQKTVLAATQERSAAEQALAPLQQALETARQADHQSDVALQALLEKQTIGQWRAKVEQLQQASRLFASIVQAAQRHVLVQKTLATASAEHGLTRTRLGAAQSELATCRALLAAREQAVHALEAQQALRQRVASLEEERRQLRDGEPCPLCGSTEHPFTDHEALPDRQPPALQQVRHERDDAARQVSNAEIAVARLEASLNGQQQRLQELHAELATHRETVIALLADAARTAGLPPVLQQQLSGDPATAPVALQERLAQTEAESNAGRDRLTQLEHAQDARDQARARLQRVRDELDRASQTLRTLDAAVVSAASRAEEAQKQCEVVKQSASQALRQWNEHISQLLGAGPGDALPAPDVALQRLRDRAGAWDERVKQCTALEQNIHGIQAGQSERRQRLAALEQSIASARDDVRNTDDALAVARNERTARFGSTDPDARTRELQQAIDQARTNAQHTGTGLHQAALAWTQARTRTDELKHAHERLAQDLETARPAFLQRLQYAGFATEDDFLKARLSSESISNLRSRRDALHAERASIAGQLLSNQSRHESLQKARPELADTGANVLQERATVLAQQLEEKRQTVAGLRHRLAEDDARRRHWQAQATELDDRRRDVQRWDTLHALIGSSDGKKFRNFAQGLTFEIMVGHANRQLQRMSDRYLLVRDRHEPLMLNVIDNYQAGDIRPTRNLSGGESFIVSLALALGLSAMSSEKIRVDSLFLDEGFGTLDEDALDVALDTLATLQQEGKLIGVISHVEALKERIGTRLQVTPVSGGRSRLSGPGVSGG